MKIKSIKILPIGYQITIVINGNEFTGVTFLDYDDSLKVIIDNKKYELIGLSEIREA